MHERHASVASIHEEGWEEGMLEEGKDGRMAILMAVVVVMMG